MPEELSREVIPSTSVICQELDGEMVILDLQQEQYFGLNDVGTRMWQLMSEGRTTDKIIKTLLGEFDVDEDTLRSDLTALIQQLTNAKLARIASRE